MSSTTVADAIRELVNDAIGRIRLPADRIDNQLSSGQMAPPQNMPGGGYAPRPHEHDADDISSGVLSVLRIPDLAGDVTGALDATVISSLQGATLDLSGASATDVIVYDGSSWVAGPGGGGGGGTVTSVALALPSIFSVTGSPVTISGTLTGALVNQSANTLLAGPTSGGAATPAFRALVASDLPAGTGTVTSVGLAMPASMFDVTSSPITTSGTINVSFSAQAAREFMAGPVSGGDTSPSFRTLQASDMPAAISARVYNNATISVANNTVQALTFNSERWDSSNLHSTSTNTSRLTVSEAGYYAIGAHVVYSANATGTRALYIRLNGGSFLAPFEQPAVTTAARGTAMTVSTTYYLNASDYVEAYAFQDSGAALNILVLANYSPEFWIYRLL